MNIDSLLATITVLTWVILAALILVLFIRNVQEHGFVGAFTRLISLPVLLLLLVPIGLSILSASLVFIQPQEAAVVVSVVNERGYRDETMTSGLHFIVPLAEQTISYPIYWQTYTMSNKPIEGEVVGDDSIVARTSDGQEVSLDCSIIYRIKPEQVVRVHINWQERYRDDLIRSRTRGLIRTLVSQFTVTEVNSRSRKILETQLNEQLGAILESEGFELADGGFVLRNIAFSREYAASVEQKQVAEEGIVQRRNEAQQIRNLAQGRAQARIIEAEARATAIVIEAQAQATAVVVKAEAESDGLQLINEAVSQNSELLTYQYINKLSPNIKVLLVPNTAPVILPLTQDMLADSPTAPLTPTETLTPTLSGPLIEEVRLSVP